MKITRHDFIISFAISLCHCGTMTNAPLEPNGKPVSPLYVSAVDASVQPLFYELQSSLGAIGIDILDSTEGYKVVADNAMVAAYNEKYDKHASGYCDRTSLTIVVPHTEAPGSAFKVLLAHEIGHALGLEHSEDGIMTHFINYACVGQEVECLRQALISQGFQM